MESTTSAAGVKTGLEVLRDEAFAALENKRVGVMTNPSAVDRELNSAYRILTDAPQVNTVALFGPEHGFAGAAPDAEHVASGADPRTGLPVYSLYGETYRPTEAMLHDVDVLVCDIQDVGVRFYTYTWTVSHILEAAGEHGVEVVILDRPNPLDGVVIEGPQLDRSFSSFVGRFPVPVRHGLTLGELTRMINTTWNPTPAELTIIPCTGWSRAMTWESTGLPWIPSSPNMPHLSTLHHYPGACLVEGTQLSEGRGTTLPFEIAGAPWIDALALVDRLHADGWAASMGARFRPHSFRPSASTWAGQNCHGVQVTITDPSRWHPVEVWLGLIATIRAMYPEHFTWLPAHPDTGQQHFDRLIGSAWARKQIESDITAGKPIAAMLATFAAEWSEDCHAFELQRQPYLIYD